MSWNQRSALLLLAASLALVSCAGSPRPLPAAAPSQTPAQALKPQHARPTETVERIFTAIREGDIEAMRACLASCDTLDMPVAVDARDHAATPLMFAVDWNLNEEGLRAEMARALLEAGSDPDVENDAGLSAFDYALFYGRTGAVERVLLEGGADPFHADPTGRAALANHIEGLPNVVGMRLLLERGADPEALARAVMIFLQRRFDAWSPTVYEDGELAALEGLFRDAAKAAMGAELASSERAGEPFIFWIVRECMKLSAETFAGVAMDAATLGVDFAAVNEAGLSLFACAPALILNPKTPGEILEAMLALQAQSALEKANAAAKKPHPDPDAVFPGPR